ncbi:MAG: hypothetical protein IPH78_00635 [Bacteroidetes bacterium]|nr:hypothetical protein [Bacteroidota bacterium]
MKILRILCSALLPLLLWQAARAQPQLEDVVYLKNGSIIRGSLKSAATENPLRIELLGGSLFVFQQSEIDSIKKENVLKRNQKALSKNYFRKDRGYRHITEFGFIYGTDLKPVQTPYYNGYQRDDFGVSIHTINGYQVWPYLYVGAGLGIDRFVNYQQTFSPFYMRLASEFLKKRATPYVFADLGYSHLWKQKSDEWVTYQNKGGLYVAVGGGVRIYTQSRASVLLSASYRRNASSTRWWYTQSTDYVYFIQRSYQRLSINVGVTF